MSKVSVVINTRNEAKVIARAITSVQNFANEVVVIDMQSIDDTAKIAKGLGAKVYNHEPLEYVEPARNFGIEKASNEWILILDPDEEIPKSLAKKLKEITEKPTADYYRVPRKNIIFNKWMRHSRYWPDYNIRFFKKGTVSWNEIIHTVPVTTGDGADIESEEEFAITHHHYESIEQYIERLNRYTSIQAKKLQSDQKEFSWQDLIKKPSSEFLSRYFFGEGFRDGIHGLAVASLQGLSELVVYLKLWQLEGFQEKRMPLKSVVKVMREAEKDSHYWQADARIHEEPGVKSITHKVRRRLKL
jgi:(heptosyl)LPS beta-1,4-glucosyltransferase